ncbi:unnamed protein product, partial [marine sediment metagenome]
MANEGGDRTVRLRMTGEAQVIPEGAFQVARAETKGGPEGERLEPLSGSGGWPLTLGLSIGFSVVGAFWLK